MLRVYSEYYLRKYNAPIYSISAFCCIMSVIVVIFVPFILVVTTHHFWIYVSRDYEQPQVDFTGEVFINVLTTDSKSYCSVTKIHQADQDQGVALAPIVETYQEDSNNDGANDILTFKATIPVYSAKLVRQVNLII